MKLNNTQRVIKADVKQHSPTAPRFIADRTGIAYQKVLKEIQILGASKEIIVTNLGTDEKKAYVVESKAKV